MKGNDTLSQCSESPSEALLAKIAEGDHQAFDELFALYRAYLRRIIDARLEPQLRSRVDPSDIVQDTFIVASQRIDDFLARRPTSAKYWLRGEAMQRLANAQRRHYAQKRDLSREAPVDSLSAASIAGPLLGERPCEILQKKELLAKVVAAVEKLAETDREILLLRYMEGLSNREVAEILKLEPNVASLRHGRALSKLGKALKRLKV